MKTIGIIGLGWLGKQFADAYKNQYKIWGTSTNPEKANTLKEDGLETIVYSAEENNTQEIDKLIHSSDFILLTIPPKNTITPDGIQSEMTAYFDQLSPILNRIPADKKIIFTSSTGVYSGLNGNLDEQSIDIYKPQNNLQFIEKQLFEKYKQNCIVLRLGGLVSDQRHYGVYFAGKENIPNGLDVVNLVHTQDVIQCIHELIILEKFGHSYNIVSDCHQTRQEFYSNFCINRNLTPPTFTESESAQNKIIANQFIKNTIDFKFRNLAEIVNN